MVHRNNDFDRLVSTGSTTATGRNHHNRQPPSTTKTAIFRKYNCSRPTINFKQIGEAIKNKKDEAQ